MRQKISALPLAAVSQAVQIDAVIYSHASAPCVNLCANCRSQTGVSPAVSSEEGKKKKNGNEAAISRNRKATKGGRNERGVELMQES
jgi:hypothetical protein